jgi:hypothetical protein
MYVDYTRHYNKLIKRAPKIRPTNYFTEGHHVVPRCIGGTDNDGIAYLTPEEHYIAHLLLVKIYPNEPKLVYAANAMSTYKLNGRRLNNKSYGWLRKKHSKIVKEFLTGKPRSHEVREKISAAQKGRPLTPKQEAARLAKVGKPKTEEQKRKQSLAMTGRKLTTEQLAKRGPRGPMSEKQRLAISAARKGQTSNRKGKKMSEEHRRKISESNKQTYALKHNLL